LCNSNLSGVKADQMVFNHHQKLCRVFIAYLVAFPFIAPGITMKRRFSENDFMAYLPFRYEIYRCKEKKTQINLRKMVLVNLCKRFLRLKLKFVLSIKTRPHKHTCTCHITHINTCIHAFHEHLRQIGKLFYKLLYPS